MRTRLIAAAALLALPTMSLAAQRSRGSRSDADRPTEMFDRDNEPKGPTLRTRDVEDLSAIKLLIDKHKDLQLSDDQVKSLKERENAAKTVNAPFLKMVDSLVHEFRPPLNPSPDDRARMRATHDALMNVIGTIRDNYTHAADSAVAQFTPEQQQKAKDLMAKQREDGDKSLREKLGGGGRREGGQ